MMVTDEAVAPAEVREHDEGGFCMGPGFAGFLILLNQTSGVCRCTAVRTVYHVRSD